jgi:hypothetical protein
VWIFVNVTLKTKADTPKIFNLWKLFCTNIMSQLQISKKKKLNLFKKIIKYVLINYSTSRMFHATFMVLKLLWDYDNKTVRKQAIYLLGLMSHEDFKPKFVTHSKQKLTFFATKSSEIVISSRTAGSTLQKRSLLYKTQKN